MVRILNYKTMQIQVLHQLASSYGDPVCVTIHPSGILVAIAFKEHIRLFDVLLGELREKGSIFVKQCHVVSFSHGGHYLACASNILVNIYGSYTAKLVHSFTDHLGHIRDVVFNNDDSIIVSVGFHIA